MESMTAPAIAVTVGVDTHLDQHVAAVIDPKRERLAEVRAELDRLRTLEADLVGLLERQPDPACPDMTAGAAAWCCAPDCSDPCQPSEGR